MVYSKKMDEIYGELMYPKALPTAFSITPTIKEVVTSWGIETAGAKQMGIKVKGTHFKLDTPIGKKGIKEIAILHARDDGDFTNLYTHRYSILAIPMPKEPRQKDGRQP
jgi:hypothetical protein